MFRPTRLSSLRRLSQLPSLHQAQVSQRRLVSFTPPAQRSRSFKNGAARWAIAAGGLYWYMTRDVDVFAEDAQGRLASRQSILETHNEAEQLPTVDAVAASRREAREAKVAAKVGRSETSPQPPRSENSGAASSSQLPASESAAAATSKISPSNESGTAPTASAGNESARSSPAVRAETSPDSLEQEAEAEGAFNEETGEINWDCPCLGGMAYGPCGTHFREAFSCFVFSKEDPKGIDCIDNFKNMQDCFRQHPDVYGSELTDMDEDPDVDGEGASVGTGATAHARDSIAADAEAQSPSQSSPSIDTTQSHGGPATATAPKTQGKPQP